MGFKTHVSAIAGSDNETTVEDELHVASPRSFSSSCGDVFAHVAGGDDDLSLTDVVILYENHLEEVTNILVIIDNSSNAVDQVNNGLGHPVSRGSLPAEDRHSGGKLLALFR